MERAVDLDQRLKAVEDALEPYFQEGVQEKLDELSEEERARLNVVLAYAMTSLYFIFLKTQGVSTANHPVKKELQRIQDHVLKLKAAGEKLRQAKANEEAAEKLVQQVQAGILDNDEGNQDEKGTPSGTMDKKKKKKKKKKKSGKDDEDDDSDGNDEGKGSSSKKSRQK